MVGEAEDRRFAGSIPEAYERYLVPLIFAGYAEDLATRAAALRPTRILEVAAGTGALTRALARVVPDADIVATDLNQPMLDLASSRTHASNVRWQQADAQALPFEDDAFDLVVCQFGVMFFPDRRAAYREVHRVLAPRGAFLFNTWDRIEENEVPMVACEAVAALFPDDPPLFPRRIPHGYHDVDVVRADLEAANFGAVTIETLALRSRAATARDSAIGFCAGTPLRNEIETRGTVSLDAAIEAATAAVTGHFGATDIDGRIQAHIVLARR